MAKLAVFVVGDASSAKAAMAETGAAAETMGAKVTTAAVGMKDAALGVVKAFVPMLAAFEAAKFAKGAIDNAEQLKKAQDSLAVSIRHTGGDMKKLGPQYAATAKAASQYGVNVVDATTSLARATLLTGDAKSAQNAYTEALVISKATGKDFNAVLTATSKAQEGSTGSLARYGILLPKVTTAQDALKASNKNATDAQMANAKAIDTATAAQAAQVQIMQRFGGQADANTSAADRLRANFSNLETAIGTLLLPAFNQIVEAADRWISNAHNQKMIMDTLKTVIADVSTAFGVLKSIIQTVDSVTGGFGNTVKIVIGLAVAAKIAAWSGALRALIVRLVAAAAAEDALAAGAVAASAAAVPAFAAIGAAALAALPELAALASALVGVYLAYKGAQVILRGKHGPPPNYHKGLHGGPQLGTGGNNGPTGRAIGGSVLAGMPYLVGERGMELFVPRSSGTIVPNHQLGGGGGGNVIFQPGAVVVHGSADAAFAKTLAGELATQLRGGRVPAFQQAIAAI